MSIVVQDIVTVDSVDEVASNIVIRMQPVVILTDDELFDLCQVNRELRIERNGSGELIIMSPAGAESSNLNGQILMQLFTWANRDGTGIAFDSSAGFRLPSGAMRSPDASWIRLSQWNQLTENQRKRFAPICPDFVIELRSETDRLRTLQDKMQEYIDNGAEMGLLIDPINRQVHIYRRELEVEVLNHPKSVCCDPLLPGFTLDLSKIL